MISPKNFRKQPSSIALSNNVKVRNIDMRIYKKENWNKNREGVIKFNQMLKWGSWQKKV